MSKDNLKIYIARKAYDIGFGAKKNFASFDILRKSNEYISFISLIVGILALAIKDFNSTYIALSMVILGVIGLYINKFECKRNDYEKIGIKFTELYNELHKLYLSVDLVEPNEIPKIEEKVQELEKIFYEKCISDQVWFSSWFAHYKFFYQFQSNWISEELKLSFFKDKIPLSLIIFIFILLVSAIVYLLQFNKLIF